MNRTLFYWILGVTAVACAATADEQPRSTPNQASVVIDTDAAGKPYDPMIFGGSLEHFGRQVYGGVFELGSPLADIQERITKG